MFTNYSKPIELTSLNEDGSNIEEVKQNMYKLKHNLLRQKIFLDTLTEARVFYKNNLDTPRAQINGFTCDYNQYKLVYEVCPTMALSMGRIFWENLTEKQLAECYQRHSEIPQSMKMSLGSIPMFWHVVSPDYSKNNPFGIKLGFDVKPKINGSYSQMELYIVQGGPIEHSFQAATADCDLIFGDVYSEFDYATQADYVNLYSYLLDLHSQDNKSKTHLMRKQYHIKAKKIITDVIYYKKHMDLEKR